MNKAHVTHLLSDYLEEGLSRAGEEKVRAHLSFCNACRQALADTERNLALLKTTPAVHPPAGLEERILAGVRRELDQPASTEDKGFEWPSWLTPLRGLALAATCAVVFLVVRHVPRDFSGRVESRKAAPAPRPAGPMLDKRAADAAAISPRTTERDITTGSAEPPTADEMAPSDANVAGNRVESLRAPAAAGPVQQREKELPSPPEKSLSPGSVETKARSAEPSAPPRADGVSQLGSASVAALEPIARRGAPGGGGFPMAGNHSAIEKPLEMVVSTQAEWEGLWNRHTARIEPRPALPPVNFETHYVIAIFAGSQPTGGYRIEIASVDQTTWEGAPARVVRYRVVGPPPGVVTTQVISQPFLFSLHPRFSGRVFFEKVGASPQ